VKSTINRFAGLCFATLTLAPAAHALTPPQSSPPPTPAASSSTPANPHGNWTADSVRAWFAQRVPKPVPGAGSGRSGPNGPEDGPDSPLRLLPELYVIEFDEIRPAAGSPRELLELRAKVGNKVDHPLRAELERLEKLLKQGATRHRISITRRGSDAIVTTRGGALDQAWSYVTADGLTWWDDGRTVTLRQADRPLSPSLDAWPFAGSAIRRVSQMASVESSMAEFMERGAVIREVADGWEIKAELPSVGMIRIKVEPIGPDDLFVREVGPVDPQANWPSYRLEPSPAEWRRIWPYAGYSYTAPRSQIADGSRLGAFEIRMVILTPISELEFATRSLPPTLQQLEERWKDRPQDRPPVLLHDLRDPVAREEHRKAMLGSHAEEAAKAEAMFANSQAQHRERSVIPLIVGIVAAAVLVAAAWYFARSPARPGAARG
jgi:hypothetical protein